MRKIEYILIHDLLPEGSNLKSRHRSDRNSGYHYVVNSEGVVLNPIDISLVGQMQFQPREPDQRIFFSTLNDRSIGIQYNGNLARDFELATRSAQLFQNAPLSSLHSQTDAKRSTLSAQLITLIQLLLKLREHFSSAVILGVDELDRWHTRVSDTMNQLRTELSNIDYDQEAEEQNFPC